MTKTFTHNELIQYVYNELPAELTTPLETVLKSDHALAGNCAELMAAKRNLDKLRPEPSVASINNILMYSRNFNLQS
jgi:hypothetical protein